MTKIYVGNLPWSATEDELREMFAAHGEVESVSIVTDRDTGRSRGFGFVEMDDEGAKKAIAAVNGHEMEGRALRVDAAREKPRRD
ncbi:MAG: RNA-binding protein [Acidobacteriota bacterium]|nr:RNA-binding protein [Acidobacteriota bacterium]